MVANPDGYRKGVLLYIVATFFLLVTGALFLVWRSTGSTIYLVLFVISSIIAILLSVLSKTWRKKA